MSHSIDPLRFRRRKMKPSLASFVTERLNIGFCNASSSARLWILWNCCTKICHANQSFVQLYSKWNTSRRNLLQLNKAKQVLFQHETCMKMYEALWNIYQKKCALLKAKSGKSHRPRQVWNSLQKKTRQKEREKNQTDLAVASVKTHEFGLSALPGPSEVCGRCAFCISVH